VVGRASTILSMTALPHTGRVLLVPEARNAAAGPEAAKIRRYRLARLRLLERRDSGAERYPQLLKSYD
jgi:hypothetical protein